MITTNLILSVLLATNGVPCKMHEIELVPDFAQVLAKRCGFCKALDNYNKAVEERGNLLYYIPFPEVGECTCVYTNGVVNQYILKPVRKDTAK